MKTFKPEIKLDGLSPEKVSRINSNFAEGCRNFRPEAEGLSLETFHSVPEEILALVASFPYPQIFVCSDVTLVCTSDKIYEYNNVTRSSTLFEVYQTELPGKTWSVADFGIYIVLTNGVDVVIKDPESKNYFSNLQDNKIPLSDCYTNFNGQMIAGGVADTWHTESIESVFVPSAAVPLTQGLSIEIQTQVANIETPVLSLEEEVEETSNFIEHTPQGDSTTSLTPLTPVAKTSFGTVTMPVVPVGYTLVGINKSVIIEGKIYTLLDLIHTASQVSAFTFIIYTIGTTTFSQSSVYTFAEAMQDLKIDLAFVDQTKLVVHGNSEERIQSEASVNLKQKLTVNLVSVVTPNFNGSAVFATQLVKSWDTYNNLASNTELKGQGWSNLATIPVDGGGLVNATLYESFARGLVVVPSSITNGQVGHTWNLSSRVQLAYSAIVQGFSVSSLPGPYGITHCNLIISPSAITDWGHYFRNRTSYVDVKEVQIGQERGKEVLASGASASFGLVASSLFLQSGINYYVYILTRNQLSLDFTLSVVKEQEMIQYTYDMGSVPTNPVALSALIAMEDIANVSVKLYGSDTTNGAGTLLTDSFQTGVYTPYRYYSLVCLFNPIKDKKLVMAMPETQKIFIENFYAKESKEIVKSATYTISGDSWAALGEVRLSDRYVFIGQTSYAIVTDRMNLSVVAQLQGDGVDSIIFNDSAVPCLDKFGYCTDTDYLYICGGATKSGGFSNSFYAIDLRNGQRVDLDFHSVYIANCSLIAASTGIYSIGGQLVGGVINTIVHFYSFADSQWSVFDTISADTAKRINQENICFDGTKFFIIDKLGASIPTIQVL